MNRSSTPTKIKLSHQGEIKLVSGWGTTLPKNQMKVINLTKKQTRSVVLIVKKSANIHPGARLSYSFTAGKKAHIIQTDANKK
jgi:hypothetical protein